MLDATSDPAVDELVSSRGPAAYGIMVQVFSELHAFGNRRDGNPSSEYIVRRVAHDLYASEEDVRDTCDEMARLGLLDAAEWERGLAANEHASADVNAYWAKVDGGRKGVKVRYDKKKPQEDGIGQLMPVQN